MMKLMLLFMTFMFLFMAIDAFIAMITMVLLNIVLHSDQLFMEMLEIIPTFLHAKAGLVWLDVAFEINPGLQFCTWESVICSEHREHHHDGHDETRLEHLDEIEGRRFLLEPLMDPPAEPNDLQVDQGEDGTKSSTEKSKTESGNQGEDVDPLVVLDKVQNRSFQPE